MKTRNKNANLHAMEMRTRRTIKLNLQSLLPSTGTLNETPPGHPHPQPSQGALKMRRYRLRIKSDDKRYREAKQDEKFRSVLRRQCMSEEQKLRNRELSKIRMRLYRERKKQTAAVTCTVKSTCSADKQKPHMLTRENQKQLEQQRRKKREAKQRERARMSAYKKRWVREKNRLRMQKKREQEREKKRNRNTTKEPVPQMNKKEQSPSKADKELKSIYKCLKETQEDLKKKHTTCRNPRKNFLWSFTSKISKKYRLKRNIASHIGVRYKTLLKYSKLRHCPCQNKRRSDATPLHVEDSIREFYMHPDVSSCLPHKKCIGKALQPKYVMHFSLASAYTKWKKENGRKVGLRKFEQLRPPTVLTQKNTKLNQCLCEYCTNIQLKVKVVNQCALKYNQPDVKLVDKYHAINLTCCPKEASVEFHKKDCVLRKCQFCGVNGLKAHLSPLMQNHGEDQVEWTKWKLVDGHCTGKGKRMALTSESGKLEDLVSQLIEEMKPFSQHIFNALWQHRQYRAVTSNIPENTVVCVMDFAENYTCLHQNEVQSAHWCKNQVTLHPIVAQYTCPDDGGTVRECVDILSADTRHDSHAVSAFTGIAYRHLTQVRKLSVVRAIQFTDGCASQYKSKMPFVDLSFSKEDFGFQVERHFFGSRHGKGPCDGEGGIVKKAVERAVKSGQSIVLDATSMYEFCKNNLSKPAQENGQCKHFRRVFYLVNNIERQRPEREGKTLVGTRKLHSVIGVSPGKVRVRDLSCFCSGCENGELCVNNDYTTNWTVKDVKTEDGEVAREDKECQKEAEFDEGLLRPDENGHILQDEHQDLEAECREAAADWEENDNTATPHEGGIQEGGYILCRIQRNKTFETYVAQVLAVNGETLQVKYMREVFPHQFVWPEVDDIWNLPRDDVLRTLQPPILQAASSTRVRYLFPEE